jgi:hypothetical protein
MPVLQEGKKGNQEVFISSLKISIPFWAFTNIPVPPASISGTSFYHIYVRS